MTFSIHIMDAGGKVVIDKVAQTPDAIIKSLRGCNWIEHYFNIDDCQNKLGAYGASIWDEISGDALFITPEENDLYELWMSMSGLPRKLLGFIPWFSKDTDFLIEACPKATVEDAVRHFTKKNQHWFAKNFKKV